jgi:hypothetical protein
VVAAAPAADIIILLDGKQDKIIFTVNTRRMQKILTGGCLEFESSIPGFSTGASNRAIGLK